MNILKELFRWRATVREKITELYVTWLNKRNLPKILQEPEAAEGLYLDRLRLGALGEEAAARLYRRDFYQVLFNNYRSPFGEIDLIVRKEDQLVLVEVRTRDKNGLLRPAETVGPEKQRKLILTGRYLLAQHPDLDGLFIRYDVVEVFYEGGYSYDINRIENAFDLSAATNVQK